MSQQQIAQVTLVALSLWAATNTKESYSSWLASQKRAGFLWGADETLEEGPNVE